MRYFEYVNDCVDSKQDGGHVELLSSVPGELKKLELLGHENGLR